MNSFEKLMPSFKKIDIKFKYLLGFSVILILIALFFPRNKNIGVKLLPVPGSSYYQAVFEGFSEDTQIQSALSDNKPCFVAFVASWCGYCKKLKPKWDNFKETRNKYKANVNVLSIDCADDKYKELAKQFKIDGYPSIKYFPNGLKNSSEMIDYNGNRTHDGFNSFLSKYLNL
jgi:thiol-disulfide isomerase/thioredoxin